ncbi:MAG: type II toxin-antitoxin system HicB family antitoxin [Fimbriimonadales bacterium]|nr:type II toxin-antitoxin system HicB family antitoxin [Fimbriimonadales bacterium]
MNAVAEVLISIHLEPLEEGGYLATSDDLQGLVAQGRTVAETLEIAQDVARKIIESYIEHGDPLPDAVLAALQRQPTESRLLIPVGVAAEIPASA